MLSNLSPVAREEAHPNSLSAKVGLECQPLHTDGAHLRPPPDVIVLASMAPNATPTRLFRPEAGAAPGDAMMHGIFRVDSGNNHFYATARHVLWLRYDPGCMTPCDQRARAVSKYFNEAQERAQLHQWTETSGQVLAIHNKSALHARDAVVASDTERALQRVAFWFPETR